MEWEKAAEAMVGYGNRAVPGRPVAWAKGMLDVFSASDEIAMVRFRLLLHEPLAFKTIVLESNYTHTGQPKPLHIANALSAEEVSRHNVQLINVPFSDSLRRRANCTHRKCILMLEDAQRRELFEARMEAEAAKEAEKRVAEGDMEG